MTYGYNYWLGFSNWRPNNAPQFAVYETVRLARVQSPVETVTIADSNRYQLGGAGGIPVRHTRGAVVSFVDGHTKWLTREVILAADGNTSRQGVRFRPF
jgi:prepilin-type processing-associated H-X9-DG protein